MGVVWPSFSRCPNTKKSQRGRPPSQGNGPRRLTHQRASRLCRDAPRLVFRFHYLTNNQRAAPIETAKVRERRHPDRFSVNGTNCRCKNGSLDGHAIRVLPSEKRRQTEPSQGSDAGPNPCRCHGHRHVSDGPRVPAATAASTLFRPAVPRQFPQPWPRQSSCGTSAMSLGKPQLLLDSVLKLPSV
jgi:hypothetical protein